MSRLYSKPKTPLTREEQSNVVYRIPCKDCHKSYIGQTSRCLKGRITSHKSDCRRGVHSCSLAEHVINEDHQADWEGAEILEKADSYYKRIFLEMVHINLDSTCLNKKSDTQDLSAIYSYILQLERERYLSLNDFPAPDE